MDYYTTMEELRTITMQSELRGYIGQLSFHLNLPFHDGDPRERFQIKVSESRDKLTVIDKVANNSEDMELPARISEHAAQYIVSEPSAAPNCISRDKKKMGFSYRLEVDQEHALALRQNSLNDDYVPWDADYMKDRGDLLCRYCDYPVAHCGYGWRWRNLPSSNWADMMDLWHCHKPHSREDQLQAAAEERSASRRGIGAGNRVVARRQAVYVDISTLLLSKDDCWTIKLEVRIDTIFFFPYYPSFHSVYIGPRFSTVQNRIIIGHQEGDFFDYRHDTVFDTGALNQSLETDSSRPSDGLSSWIS